MYTETKKESIGLFNYCCRHRMERWIVFIVYTEKKKESIQFIYLIYVHRKEK